MDEKQLDKLEKVITLIDTDYVSAEDFSASLVVLIEQLKKLDDEGDEKIQNLATSISSEIARIQAKILKQGEVSSTNDKKLSDAISRVKEDIKGSVADLKERIYGLKLRKGEDGKDGKQGQKGDKGDSGSPDEPKDIKKKLESLKGEDRLDAKAIKNLPNATREIIREVGGFRAGAMETPLKDATTGSLLPKDASGAWLVNQGGSGSSLELQTNGTHNGSQTLLNLQAGTNVTLTDNGTGTVTIDASFAGGGNFLIGQTSGIVSAPTPGGTTETWLGDGAGLGTSTTATVAIGNLAGQGATSADGIIAIGYTSALNATSATSAVMIGVGAGSGATGASNGVFLGSGAGTGITGATDVLAFGTNAGENASGATQGIFLGVQAGSNASGAIDSIFQGYRAGFTATNAAGSVFLGRESGNNALNAANSVFLGYQAGNAATDASYSFFAGYQAGQSASNATNSIFFGQNAGNLATDASNSIFMGYRAGLQSTTLANSIVLGYNSANLSATDNTGSTDNWNILIGNFLNTGGFQNSVIIGASTDSSPLVNTMSNEIIFSPNLVNWQIAGVQYIMPTSIGSTGDVLTITNSATGQLAWQAGGSGTVTSFTFTDGNGFDGTVTNSTTTPTLSLTTSLTTASIPFIGASGALSQDNARFFWDNTNKTLNVVSTTDTFFSATGSVNSFLQGNIQNTNSGASASTDWVVTADNGTATTHYADFGINGSGGGGAPFTTANHAYLYSIDDTMNIGALGASSQIRIFTTGGTSPVQRAVFDENGRLGISQTAPASKLHINTNSLGVTQADSSGIILANTTAAAAGAQQISPGHVFVAQGWKTNATAASQEVRMRLDLLPVQGAAAPTATLRFAASINGGAYATNASIDTNGSAIFQGGVSANSYGAANSSLPLDIRGGTAVGGAGIDSVRINPLQNATNTSGSATSFRVFGTFAPTSGTGTFAALSITPTINQGAVTGTPITRGLYIDPTLTSALDFRALEVVTGKSLFRDIRLTTAGDGISIKQGTNATAGRATLVGGTVTVSTTKASTTMEVFLTHRVAGGTLGVLSVGTVTAGTSFVINSSSATDTSDVSWIIIENL